MSRTIERYASELLKLCTGKSKAEVERTVDRFAGLILERRQGALLPAIMEAVKEAPEPDSVVVTMTTAVDADTKTSDTLQKSLEKKLGQPVHLRTETDPSLIGGATLRYEDVLFDGSVRQRLDSLKRQLSQ